MKRLSKSSGQGAQEFKNEAVLVTKLQHKNLVEVLGFCLEGEEKINPKSIDFLFMGDEEITFTADFIETTATHGTGCTFAAAIAANLARGKSLKEAVESAKRFVTEAIRTAPHLGKGHSPINQLVRNF